MTAIETKPKNIVEVSQEQLNQELGDTGTILVKGILSQQDYNPELTGSNRIKVYDQMRADGTVKSSLLVVKLPIMSAKWYIKPVSKDQKDIDIKDFIESQLLKNPNFNWNATLKEVLTFCDYGNSIWEKVFTIVQDGKFKGKIGWEKFGHRLSKTILRWEMDGGEPGIVQLLPVGKTEQGVDNGKQKTLVNIPKWKLLYFILDKEGSNYEGISLLRAAYKHWYYKDNYYKIDAVATERHGLGIPVVTSPPQAQPKDKAKANMIAKNIRANSQSYADLPTGFKLEFIDMKSNTLKDSEPMVLHHDRQISKSVLAEFLELGSSGGSGSYALSATLAEIFYLSEQYMALLVRDEFQKAINELVDLNYGHQDEYPTLEFGSIGQIDMDKLANFLQKTTASNIIVPDDELERHVRQMVKLPEAVHIQENEEGEDINEDGQVGGKRPVVDNSSGQVDKPTGTGKPAPAPARGAKPEPKPAPTNPKTKMQEFVEDTETLLKNVNRVINAKEKRSRKA